MRLVASFLLAAGLVLASVLPGLAYNEENVKHVRIERISPIACNSTIELRAHLTDKQGNAVVGAQVNWTLKKSQSGDTITPTSSSDTHGDAYAELKLGSFSGNRQVVATVAGTKAKDQLTINAKKKDAGCSKTGTGEGAVEGATGVPVVTLPPTTTAQDVIPAAAAQVLPVVGILTLVALVSLLTTTAWRKRASRGLPRA